MNQRSPESRESSGNMNQSGPENRENPYTNPAPGGGYDWDPAGKRLAVLCRILSFVCMPVLWVILVLLVLRKTFMQGIVTPGGLFWLCLSVLILLYGVLVFINNLFVSLSRRLSAEGRHDFLLYRCHHVFRKNKKRRAKSLLVMAELDLQMHRLRAAEDALLAVDTEALTARQLKYYNFLGMARELFAKSGPENENAPARDEAGNGHEFASAQEWYIRFAGIKENSDRFPDDKVIRSWLCMDEPDREKVRGEIVKAAAHAAEEPEAPAAAPLIFWTMLAHCVFYLAAANCLGAGWHLRSDYNMIASFLAGVFVIALGGWVLYLVLRVSKRENGPAKGGRLARHVIAGIAWMVFITSVAGLILLRILLSGAERVIARNIVDPYTNKKYDYIAMDPAYGGTEYFRAMDPVFMEEWSEAAAYDQKTDGEGAVAGSDDSFPEGVSSSANPAGADSDAIRGTSDSGQSAASDGTDGGAGATDGTDSGTAASDGTDGGAGASDATDGWFDAQNAMQRVFSYLEDSGEYPDLAISFSANAKGDVYALISSGSENKDGNEVSFELRLYDNGERDAGGGTEREIVLEKVYPSGGYDTELLGFYLVNTETGEVTDEHKTSW